MKSPEEMEKALQRLVPPALSEKAHADVSAMLASLAAADNRHASPAPNFVAARLPSRRLPIAIAAAITIGLISAGLWSPLRNSLTQPLTSGSTPVTAPAAENETSPVLIDRMLVTDGITVEGTLTAADGRVMNQINRRVQTRERYRDARKGYLITISETRDEKVFTPKKGF